MHKFTISWSCTILKLKQAIWFSRPDCAPRSECPQFRMPVERCAQFRVPNVPRSRISERAPFRIYEHAQCWVFDRTSLQRAYVIPCAANGVVRCATGTPQRIGDCSEHAVLGPAHSTGRGCHVHACVMAIGADFKMYLLRQFCSNRVDFFTIHRRHRRKKMMDQNFEIRTL